MGRAERLRVGSGTGGAHSSCCDICALLAAQSACSLLNSVRGTQCVEDARLL